MTSARIQSRDGQLVMPEMAIFLAQSGGDGANAMSLSSSAAELTIFTSVIINQGSNFNSGTGRFTAPCAGIYEFGLQMIAGNANDIYRFTFFKNGVAQSPQLRLDTSDTTNTDYETGTMITYFELAAGDYISVYAQSDGGNDKFSNSTYDIFRGRFIG
jgi:hypothetical protein|tara:strand:+ start:967 stop:1440 length:474 start_codon:yes stop_codon:yes gene_type:complete